MMSPLVTMAERIISILTKRFERAKYLKKHSSPHSSGIIQSKHMKEGILFRAVIIVSNVIKNIANSKGVSTQASMAMPPLTPLLTPPLFLKDSQVNILLTDIVPFPSPKNN